MIRTLFSPFVVLLNLLWYPFLVAVVVLPIVAFVVIRRLRKSLV